MPLMLVVFLINQKDYELTILFCRKGLGGRLYKLLKLTGGQFENARVKVKNAIRCRLVRLCRN
jgi:hypothetical protein